MVIRNKYTRECELYEIKYSESIKNGLDRYLRDVNKDLLFTLYGNIIKSKTILYRGVDKILDSGICCKNIEKFLNEVVSGNHLFNFQNEEKFQWEDDDLDEYILI